MTEKATIQISTPFSTFFEKRKKRGKKEEKRLKPFSPSVLPDSGNLAPNRFALSTKISMSSEACT
jgi:hypothetical protein